jgi:hypothetical protein
MSNLTILGDTSGSVLIQAPAVAGSGTLTLPTTSGTVALTSQVIGISQTTQNLTASRALNTTYTNSTGKPIVVYVSVANSVSSPVMLNQIDGVTIYGAASPTANTWFSFTMIVPIGSTYLINMNGIPALQYWVETR